MKRLCIDARMLHSSGIGTYLQNLLPYLDSHYQLFLLGKEEEIGQLKLRNSEVFHTSASIYSIKELFEIPSKIPSSDLFWSPHYNVPIFPVRAKKRLVTIHDVYHLKFSDTLSFTQKSYAKIIFNAASRLSDRIITVSRFSKKELVKYLNVEDQKIDVVYNGVSSRFEQITSIERLKAVRLKYHLPEKFILFLGNVKPHKNLSNLLKAFSFLKLENSFQHYKLVIAGKKKGFITGMQNLEQLLTDQGLAEEVIFLETLQNDEVPALYNLSSLLAFPSYYEGFGLPPLEAMACGCPTISSDIECLKEIYGNSSLYVDPSDPEDIKNGIKKVLLNENLQKDLIARGLVHSKKFSWESSSAEHLHIFEKILEG